MKMERSSSHQSLNTDESFISTSAKGRTEIHLPKQTDFIEDIAVDIGGSLAKVVWFSKQEKGGRLNFAKFETAKIDQCLGFIQGLLVERGEGDSKVRIKATGGGSHKFYDLFVEKLGALIQKEDEMECLITGLNFLVRQIEYEVFTYDERRPDAMQFEESSSEIFPYMLVNIGSGVSIIKVTSNETYERISGTSLGGGTLWGLLGLLTDARDYDEMLDNANVDMLVGDIYGGDYSKIGLKSTTIASSFGKVIKVPPEERKKRFRQQDIALSLLYLVSNNIGQIAYLNAQAHGIQRIYFSGFYISGHAITMNTLSYAISFWSKGKIKANFLRHEGYLGAVGAFLRDPPENAKIGTFTENFSKIATMSPNGLYAVGTLEEYSSDLCAFPLLADPGSYVPDTSKLTEDPKLQAYWIDLLDANLHYLIDMAIQKNPDSLQRAEKFESMYRQHLQDLRQKPKAYGPLTVRSLLNLREQCLRQMGFNDIFHTVKEKENEAALKVVPEMFQAQDKLSMEELVDTLIFNILAGNMLDWGSTLIQEMFLKNGFDFTMAKSKIAFTPAFSNVEEFKNRLLLGDPYHKCLIFVDNSGADIFFGILPFVRYLLKRGTRVIIAANSDPSVNDITAGELQLIVEELAKIDSAFSSGIRTGTLQVLSSGSGSPCLDLLRVSEELCIAARDVDLVMIEGMGRAIHTNYFAEFSVDCVKIAVFKNAQIAQELGAQLYEGLVRFEPKS
ncbi:Pantothenate kinase 4 [Kappamyces sp. JEL0680]|nr:Pantothenate kinase 4 [Kappamyces sp. JEL0680]